MPTAAPKATVPPVPARNVKALEPLALIVLVEPLNVMFAPAAVPPPFVLSNKGEAETFTGPVIVITPPLVVILPPTLMAVGAV